MQIVTYMLDAIYSISYRVEPPWRAFSCAVESGHEFSPLDDVGYRCGYRILDIVWCLADVQAAS